MDHINITRRNLEITLNEFSFLIKKLETTNSVEVVNIIDNRIGLLRPSISKLLMTYGDLVRSTEDPKLLQLVTELFSLISYNLFFNIVIDSTDNVVTKYALSEQIKKIEQTINRILVELKKDYEA